MQEKDYKESYDTLRKRWSNEKLLKHAAVRRTHLEYKRITLGKRQDCIWRINNLIRQVHSTYYLGFFEATCALSGILLEQAIIYVVSKSIQQGNKITTTKRNYKSGFTIDYEINNAEDILKLNLTELIILCSKNRIFSSNGICDIAHDIRKIRNTSIHEKMPLFKLEDERLVLDLNREGEDKKYNTVCIDKSEVEDLLFDVKQITPYYCLTRTRKVLHDLFD